MSAYELIEQVHALGGIILIEGDRVRVQAPKGAITPELRGALVEHKREILATLCRQPVPIRTEDGFDGGSRIVEALGPEIVQRLWALHTVEKPATKPCWHCNDSRRCNCISCNAGLKLVDADFVVVAGPCVVCREEDKHDEV